MTSKNILIAILVIGGAFAAGFMVKLMYDMTQHMELMTGYVNSLSGNVAEMNQKVGAMADHMGHVNQNMEALRDYMGRMYQNIELMTRHMGRMDQTIHRGSETLQRWNPMDMMVPQGSGDR